MAESASISAQIAARYAKAVFDIAVEADALDRLEADVNRLAEALATVPELSELVRSPVIGRAAQLEAIARVAEALELGPEMRNALGLMVMRRRLFVLPQLVEALRRRIRDARGIVDVEVASAKPLTKDQAGRLVRALREALAAREVELDQTVDEELIGGLVVKVGSRMVDSSIATRLAKLRNAMKEVG